MYKTYCYNPRLLRLWTGKEKKEYFPLCLYYAATIVMITADKKKENHRAYSNKTSGDLKITNKVNKPLGLFGH